MNKEAQGKNNGIKKALFLLILLLLLLIFSSLLLLFLINRKPVIAFYRVDPATVKSISALLQEEAKKKDKKTPYKIVELDGKLQVKAALKKEHLTLFSSPHLDALIMYNGLNLTSLLPYIKKRKTYFPLSALDSYTTTIKTSAYTEGGSLLTLPILIDNLQIDVNTKLYRKAGNPNIALWNDLQNFLLTSSPSAIFPVIFNAKSNASVIDIYGASLEALCDYETWHKVASSIKDVSIKESKGKIKDASSLTKEYSSALSRLYEEDSKLKALDALIFSSRTKNILKSDVFNLTQEDVENFMIGERIAAAFMRLSEHRKIDYETVIGYNSIYFPSLNENFDRHFTSPLLNVLLLSRNKTVKDSCLSLATKLQSVLSNNTGLAPCAAHVMAGDKQSSDVRYWVASTFTPLPALSEAAFYTDLQRDAFILALKERMNK